MPLPGWNRHPCANLRNSCHSWLSRERSRCAWNTCPTHPCKQGEVAQAHTAPPQWEPSIMDSILGFYESAIHSNSEFAEVDKFNYLPSLLEGSAFEAIRGLTLSAANYQDAISLLKKRLATGDGLCPNTWRTLLNLDLVMSDQNLRMTSKPTPEA